MLERAAARHVGHQLNLRHKGGAPVAAGRDPGGEPCARTVGGGEGDEQDAADRTRQRVAVEAREIGVDDGRRGERVPAVGGLGHADVETALGPEQVDLAVVQGEQVELALDHHAEVHLGGQPGLAAVVRLVVAQLDVPRDRVDHGVADVDGAVVRRHDPRHRGELGPRRVADPGGYGERAPTVIAHGDADLRLCPGTHGHRHVDILPAARTRRPGRQAGSIEDVTIAVAGVGVDALLAGKARRGRGGTIAVDIEAGTGGVPIVRVDQDHIVGADTADPGNARAGSRGTGGRPVDSRLGAPGEAFVGGRLHEQVGEIADVRVRAIVGVGNDQGSRARTSHARGVDPDQRVAAGGRRQRPHRAVARAVVGGTLRGQRAGAVDDVDHHRADGRRGKQHGEQLDVLVAEGAVQLETEVQPRIGGAQHVHVVVAGRVPEGEQQTPVEGGLQHRVGGTDAPRQ